MASRSSRTPWSPLPGPVSGLLLAAGPWGCAVRKQDRDEAYARHESRPADVSETASAALERARDAGTLISVFSRGHHRPVADSGTRKGRARDRRVHAGGAVMNGGRSLPLRGRAWVVAALALLALAGAASPADAQARVGVRAGAWLDDGDLTVGVDVLIPLEKRWWLDPSLEAVDGDRADILLLNGDVLFDLDLETRATVWVGAGLAILHRDLDLPRGRDENETDLGLNLLAGVGRETSSGLQPYVQGKVVLSDDSSAALVLGLRS